MILFHIPEEHRGYTASALIYLAEIKVRRHGRIGVVFVAVWLACAGQLKGQRAAIIVDV